MAILSAPGTAPQASQLPVLPAHTLERLHAEGVHDLDDWRRLGRKRHQLFGIVPSVVKRLDAAALEVRE